MDQKTETGALSSKDQHSQLVGLHAQIEACSQCRLCETRTHAVPGEGVLNPQILFVGEAPGAQEDKLGRPFIGRSGRFLDGMIQGIGLRREETFITNVVKCRPPDNRDPRPDEVSACKAYLDRQIEWLAPRVVVTLGRFSMQRWFRGERITKIHGQAVEFGTGQIAVPLFHPAAALRNPQWRAAFAEDMQIVRRLLEKLAGSE